MTCGPSPLHHDTFSCNPVDRGYDATYCCKDWGIFAVSPPALKGVASRPWPCNSDWPWDESRKLAKAMPPAIFFAVLSTVSVKTMGAPLETLPVLGFFQVAVAYWDANEGLPRLTWSGSDT